MTSGARLGTLGRRLVWAFMLVALVSLGVLFIGTVVPHLPSGHVDPHDPVSLAWLLTATLVAVLIAALLSIRIATRLTSPVQGYLETARRFAAGDHSARPADLGPPEFAELATRWSRPPTRSSARSGPASSSRPTSCTSCGPR